MNNSEPSIPDDVNHLYKSWVFYRRTWWALHYFIGISGVIAAITSANKPQFLEGSPAILNSISWFSAVCVAVLTFLEPKKRARAYAAAWRILHKAIGVHKHGHSANQVDLYEAISQGEDIISKLDS